MNIKQNVIELNISFFNRDDILTINPKYTKLNIKNEVNVLVLLQNIICCIKQSIELNQEVKLKVITLQRDMESKVEELKYIKKKIEMWQKTATELDRQIYNIQEKINNLILLEQTRWLPRVFLKGCIVDCKELTPFHNNLKIKVQTDQTVLFSPYQIIKTYNIIEESGKLFVNKFY